MLKRKKTNTNSVCKIKETDCLSELTFSSPFKYQSGYKRMAGFGYLMLSQLWKQIKKNNQKEIRAECSWKQPSTEEQNNVLTNICQAEFHHYVTYVWLVQ